MSNNSADNALDPSCPQFDPSICRDYVRNACRRGHRCKFKHPPYDECEKMRRSERIFCHDYQNSTCRRPVCKFLHYTREEEGIFRLTGRLPDINDREVSAKAKNVHSNPLEQSPTCKDYVNGICSRGSKCKYRHITVNGDRPSDSLTSVLSWRDTLLGETDSPASLKSNFVSNEPSPPTFVTVVPSSIKSETSLPIQASISSIPQSLIPSCQATILNAAGVIVSASDSLLLKDVYVTSTSQASQPTVVGMLDHVTLSAQPSTLHHQHTIYAHAPTLTSFAHPLASVTNPVLAVVAESTAPTGPGQHPAAVLQTAPQTATYHLLSTSTRTCNTSAGSLQPQHHLLPTGSSSTSCPTVFTIPLTRFACEAPATSAAVLHHHHPQAVAVCSVPASVFSSGPQVSYPSYGIIHTDAGMDTNCTVTTRASCPTVMFPTSSESLVNCSASAAAVAHANFLTLQKRPGLATSSEQGPNALGAAPANIEPSASTVGVHHVHHELQLQKHASPSITNRSSTMAVAASLPAVSVAAAAAAAAATAIARSSNISAAAVRAGRIAVGKHRKLKQPHSMDHNSQPATTLNAVNSDTANAATVLPQSASLVGATGNEATVDGLSEPPSAHSGRSQRSGACFDWKSGSASSTTTTTTPSASAVSTTATTASPMLVKISEDDVVDEDEGVGTETAAAFAAAACIGWLFSVI